MKKAIIIPIMLGLFLSSCGTATRYASVTFDDAVYQKPGSNKYVVVNTVADQELDQLREKTHVSERAIINGKIVEPLYADEYGNVEVNLDEEKSYIILNPGESFEERLKKFDSPDFRITININSMWDQIYNPWDYYWSPYSWRVYGRMFGFHHYRPFNHPYYSPWYNGFYSDYFSIDPFIGMSPMWYSYFYMPFPMYYGPTYMSGSNYWWYSNWMYNQHYYESSGRGSRQYYSGRRDPQRGAIRSTSGESSLNSEGMRRSTARVEQVRGENVYTGSESIYRRENRFEGVGTNAGNTRTSEEFQRRGNTEVNRTASTGTVRRAAGEVNRGATEVNRNQSTGTVRRTTGEVNRSEYEGTVRRTNTESYRSNSEQNRNTNNSGNNQSVRQTESNRGQTTGTVRQPSVSTRPASGTTNTGRDNSQASQSRNYRPAAVQTTQTSRSTSGNQPSRNPFGSYNTSTTTNRSNTSTGSTTTTTSSNTSSGSSSGSSSSSSGGGSTYRR
ncbi:MAG: hypothetical protein Q8S23_00380 [Bacteroidales bacterium]|nr:hypothetical protein [Bacteroidales bacterium]